MAATGEIGTGFKTLSERVQVVCSVLVHSAVGERELSDQSACGKAGQNRGRQPAIPDPSQSRGSNHWRPDTHGDKSAKPRPPATFGTAYVSLHSVGARISRRLLSWSPRVTTSVSAPFASSRTK